MSLNDKKVESFFNCFNYDLTQFFHDDYTEVESVETPATFMVIYERPLAQPEFDIFDKIQFRIFYDKESITANNPINVKYIAQKYTPDNIKKVADTICEFFGLDDSGFCASANTETYSQQEFDLFWTIGEGESFISIEKGETDGLSLNILFYNNLTNPKFEDFPKYE